jgi:hypothetical protein
MSARNVHEARELLEARANELRDELRRIEDAINSLDLSARSAGDGNHTGRRTARQHRRGRRAEQALELIAAHPGITIRELAAKMGLKGPHYLYRVLPRLESEQLISRTGDGYSTAKR